jgi:ferritin
MLKKLINHTSELALQQAIGEELYASNLYKHLSNQCQRLGLFGAAKYFKSEGSHEIDHYQKIADYLNDRGSVAQMPSVEECDTIIKTLQDSLEIAYDLELDLGNKYAKWYSSLLSSDPFTAQFLLQFIETQRKSIGELADWLSRLELAGDDKCAILIIDKELGA